MKRRRLLLGLGTLASSSVLSGTGAFSTVEADRGLVVDLEQDHDAYLQLDTISDYSRMEDGQIVFEFDDEVPPVGVEGEGLGTNSIYEFGSVISVQNEGDRTVKLFGEYTDNELSDINLTQSTDVNSRSGGKTHLLTETNPSDPLEPGDAIEVGFVISTKDTSIGEKETSLKIIAVSDDSDLYAG